MRKADYCAVLSFAALVNEIAESQIGGKGELNFGAEGMRYDPLLAQQMLQASPP
ncbi:hypothetical protein LZ023_39215 (plasmid) [Pseudomonas silvicola]|nr:hypothetical protein LZ023_39215 [Pseudomonas silvicola]